MAIDATSVIQGLGTAKPRAMYEKDPPIALGNHTFAVINFYAKMTNKPGGLSLFLELHCLQSDNPEMVIGRKYSKGFHVSKPGEQWKRDAEFGECMQALNACTGHPLADATQAQNTCANFLKPTNPARGFVVHCRGFKRRSDETYVQLEWSTVPGQTLEQIKALREKLDAKYPSVVAQAAQHVAPQPTAPAAAPAAAPSGALDLSSLGL